MKNHSPRRAHRQRRKAITLLETTITLSSVAVLSVLLLPALSEARRQGKEVRCLANLGQLAGAALVYAAADANELAIPVHYLIGTSPGALSEYEWGGKSGMGEPQQGQNPIASKWGTVEGRGPATRELNRIIYGDVLPDYKNNAGPGQINWVHDMNLDLGVYRCPADYGYTGHHLSAWKQSQLTSFDHYGNSYAANTLWVATPGAGCVIESNSPFLKPVSRVPTPAQTVLFEENCGRFGWHTNYGDTGDEGCASISGPPPGDVPLTVRGWHGRFWMFQVAFVDGHAGMVRMRGHRQPAPHLGHYPTWSGFPVDHDFWHCAIIRGPGWQLDTLPASAVRTNISCVNSGAAAIIPIG